MSSIPYNYGSYIDAKVAMTDTGHVSAGKQIQSPASAGSRGLAKTTQFTNDRTQMQLGPEAIAESMIEIRNIMNRIDGINVPTNEMNELADDEKMEFTKILLDISAIKDRIERLSVDDDAKKSAIQSLKNAEEALVALDETAVKEDLDYRSDDILNKAGFDPSKVKEYLAVFNDHGDTSDIEQMNMDTVGLADAMSMVLASHDVKNESTNEDSVSEGAEMIAYHKHPKDNNLWTFPDAYKDDKEVESPYMSNASMRQFLSTLGYNPDFEDQSPLPAKEFIARTTQWLQKNIDKKSPEEPTTIDKNPDGPTMISGGKPEGYMNRQVKLHNELARKIIAKYPEVTHLGFN